MRRIIGSINPYRAALAAFLLLVSAPAFATSDTATQTVDGEVQASIEITAPATVNLTLLAGQTATASTTLTVNSTTSYTVTAAADSDLNKGANEARLFQYLTTGETPGYVENGEFVDSDLQLSSGAGSATGTGVAETAVTTGGITVFTGSKAEDTGTINVTFHQLTPWGTEALDGDHTYRMVVTYTATLDGV